MHLIPHTLAPLGAFAKVPPWPTRGYDMVHLVCEPDGSFCATAGNGYAVVSVAGTVPERPRSLHPWATNAEGERLPYGPGETILVPAREWSEYFTRAAKCVQNAPAVELRAVTVQRVDGIASFKATDGNAAAHAAGMYPTSDEPLRPGTFTPAAHRARDEFTLDYGLLRQCTDTMAGCLGRNMALKFRTHGPERSVVVTATTPAGLRATAVIAVVKSRELVPAWAETPYEELQRRIDELTHRLAVYESK